MQEKNNPTEMSNDRDETPETPNNSPAASRPQSVDETVELEQDVRECTPENEERRSGMKRSHSEVESSISSSPSFNSELEDGIRRIITMRIAKPTRVCEKKGKRFIINKRSKKTKKHCKKMKKRKPTKDDDEPKRKERKPFTFSNQK